ncbi:MAG: hypothetical protein ABIV36_20510 [Sphingobium limneticum]
MHKAVEAMPFKKDSTTNHSAFPISPADFVLDSAAFIARCIEAYGLEDKISPAERINLVNRMGGGVTKLAMVDAFMRQTSPEQVSLLERRSSGVNREWDKFVLVDLLERYAPDDDWSFLKQAYRQLLDREPDKAEEIEALYDLRGDLSRRSWLQRLAEKAPDAFLSSDVLGTGNAINEVPHSTGFSASGRARIILMQQIADGSYLVAPSLWTQNKDVENGVIHLQEGWVLAGPKRDVTAGAWLLSVDIVQHDEAEVVLDMSANSGLDLLSETHLRGTTRMGLRVTIEPYHHFIEVRLRKPQQPDAQNWIKIRNLSLEYLG